MREPKPAFAPWGKKISDLPYLNDVHSQLNRTLPDAYRRVRGEGEIRQAVAEARQLGLPTAVCAGRHAMGGQQFIAGGMQIDMDGMRRVLDFDAQRGLITAEAGIQWPELMRHLDESESNHSSNWGIRQKQTGADRFSLGGSLAANIHGRGLRMKPFIDDIEAFNLIGADGTLRRCDRRSNHELFSLAIGGYGLFGVVVAITLRLVAWCRVRREVELIAIDAVLDRFEERADAGCLFGDFQFAIDPASADFLRRGVLSCYRQVADDTPLTTDPIHLERADWNRLLHLAHVDKTRAFEEFGAFYQRSNGQVYRSDQHQAGYYLDGYHGELDERLEHQGSEVISELYVPRSALIAFMAAVAERLRDLHADVIYGTVRLVERDDESFLRWARENWACVIFNLHTAHDAAALAHTATCKRALVDLAIEFGGSYYLTYHRHASRDQLDRCYPQFTAFEEAKIRHDPEHRFMNDWYRHYAAGDR
ncbi:MAG: FAD-binding oxidoreductase [Dokdonella sp.]